jgi:hypothetical protein
MASREYRSNCDVLSISSYSSDSKDSKDTQTPDGGYGSDGEDIWTSYVVTTTVAEQEQEQEHKYKSYTSVDPNDPLRYFLERGEITPNEYEKWKLVMKEPESQPRSKSRHRPDFGPGHNSDSDSDSDGDNDNAPTIEYGNGYTEQANEHRDPWNPNPDPTHDKRYTMIATGGAFMLMRLVQDRKLGSSFSLKLIWERFATSNSHQQQQTLQEFWQTNTLQIYESLQDLMEDQARISIERDESTVEPPRYHTTQIETLDNTFETIGRMSRCIAEDFNTPSVVAYVEEFIVSLYREIEFTALVEACENKPGQ